MNFDRNSFDRNRFDHGRNAISYDMPVASLLHPIYPTASWSVDIVNPADDTGLLAATRVSQGMDDAMARAEFEYDLATTGNYFSGDYMTRILVSMEDYLGVEHTVFVGVVPTSKSSFSPTQDKITMTAVDYSLYLTKQTLEDKDMSLLPPDDQTSEGANIAKVLDYTGVIHPFQIGQKVVGQISSARGTIIELVQGDGFRRMTLYPATGKFIDAEILRVGGMDFALADGRSVDIPYTPFYQTTGPEDWIRSVLGGANWMRVCGIEPFSIASTGGYWDTDACPAVPFMFDSKTKKWDAIQRMAKYLRYIATVKIRPGGTTPAFYFVPIASIDDSSGGLDLPAPVNLTLGSSTASDLYNFLAQPVELDQLGEDQADLVRVACQTLEGEWLEAKRMNSKVDNGEGPYLEFYDEPQDIATRIDLDAYCLDMYNLYCGRGCTWRATLMDRPDLVLYQRINVSGYGIEIPDGEYRIIKIEYEHGPAVNKTHISFMLTSAFSSLLKRGRTYTDSIIEIQRVVDHQIDKIGKTELGTCTANDGYTVTYETEAGVSGKGRDGTSSAGVPGSIPEGAKISIHFTRGGIVCLPVVASADSATNLLVVGVPTNVTAVVDPDDHNYWFLSWTPGANNLTVSTNYQTAGYPSAPGVVLPYGNPASCHTAKYAITTTRVRIRFSGPLATYYIKLWGEKNGVYSSTGATTTITSGADVTLSDGEEPEPIGVIDYAISGFFTGFGYGAGQVYPVATLSNFVYNGTDNIYIGGPPTYTKEIYGDVRDVWGDQPGPRQMLIDQYLTIKTVHGTITVSNGGYCGWFMPVDIKSILGTGANTVTIELHEESTGYYGVCALWVRTYYL